MSDDHAAEKSPHCWCGRDHRETRSGDRAQDPDNALTTLGHALLAAWRIPQAVDALDGILRRWPWLYKRLGG